MSQFRFAFSVKCPVCRAGPSHWCREQGKCVPPHRERSKEALRISCSILRPTKVTMVTATYEPKPSRL
jgi:hypothetical protein